MLNEFRHHSWVTFDSVGRGRSGVAMFRGEQVGVDVGHQEVGSGEPIRQQRGQDSNVGRGDFHYLRGLHCGVYPGVRPLLEGIDRATDR
ncbi:hypothetical protein [Actinokineospora fastidiosa]|uniref:hypothetical protein n=1 Tax=Actinokineospora fastidiosa TaxID=1816 RepID=UPI00166FCD79|nr:hypothetical protein [Actinokineospora fastidiosa]